MPSPTTTTPAAPAATPAAEPAITPVADADLPASLQGIGDTYFPSASKSEPEPKQTNTPPADKPGDPPKAPTAKDFANNRRQKKEELKAKAETADELKAEADQMRAELETLRKERDTWSTGSTQWEAKQKEWDALQKDLTSKVEAADKRYYDTYGAKYDRFSDETRNKAQSSYLEALATGPDEIDGKPIFFDQLRANPEAARAMDSSVMAYIQGREKHDAEGMQKAVESYAKALGIKDPTDEELASVKRALKAAVPHAQAIIQRDKEISEQAPQLALQSYQARHKGISDTVMGITRLDASRIEQILNDPKADVTSEDYTYALANVLANEVPEWKAEVERELARDAESLAMINPNYQPEPLMSQDAAEIAKHDQNTRELIARQREIMRNAALGRVLAKVLPTLFLKLQDAESRADDTSGNTNPGGASQNGSQDPDRKAGNNQFGAIADTYEAAIR